MVSSTRSRDFPDIPMLKLSQYTHIYALLLVRLLTWGYPKLNPAAPFHTTPAIPAGQCTWWIPPYSLPSPITRTKHLQIWRGEINWFILFYIWLGMFRPNPSGFSISYWSERWFIDWAHPRSLADQRSRMIWVSCRRWRTSAEHISFNGWFNHWVISKVYHDFYMIHSQRLHYCSHI